MSGCNEKEYADEISSNSMYVYCSGMIFFPREVSATWTYPALARPKKQSLKRFNEDHIKFGSEMY